MHAYFRNHQLYLAEKCTWLDRQVIKASKRSLMKIESWRSIAQTCDDNGQINLVKKLIKDSLLTGISNINLLEKEGFFQYNHNN